MTVQTGPAHEPTTTDATAQWEALAGDWGRRRPQTLWRTYCDLAHSALIERWLPE